MNEIKTLADLKPDQKNARKHNPRNIGMISKVIGRVGVGRSIVIDEDGNILAGNGTVEALAECGIEKVRVVETDGNEIVAVQRKGLTPEQKIELSVGDNRTAELAEWDADVLKDIQIEMPELLEGLFMPLELDELIDLPSDMGYKEGEDEAPEPPVDPITKAGDLYRLGEHRLMCGDSTNEITVGILMDGQNADLHTDPPYGIDVTGMVMGQPERKAKEKNWDEEIPEFFHVLHLFDKQIIWGGNYFTDRLTPTNDWLCWDKKNEGRSFSEFELAWTNLGKNCRIIHHQPWSQEKRYHPTQKPIAVVEWALGYLGKNIADLFGGSGSTLIACEKLDRQCFMMEIDPAYCDVIVTRWEEFTGKKAELIEQGELVK